MNRRDAISLIGAQTVVASTAPVDAQALIPVRVGASTDDGLWPLLYAMRSGLFQKNGLDVNLTPLANGAALAAAVIGGAIDIAKSSLMVLIAAHARGVAFKLVAGAAMHDSNDVADQLTVLKDSPFTSLGQVSGTTIAVNVLNSLEVYGTRLLIDKNGGESSTVKFVEMPFTAMLSALEQGRCDIAAIGNPTLTPNLQSGKLRSLGVPYNGIGPRFLIAGWFCTASYAANRAITTRFAEAMRRATIYTNAHSAEIIPMVAAYSHLQPDALKQIHFLTNATTVEPDDIQPSIDAAVRYKVIANGFPASDLIAN